MINIKKISTLFTLFLSCTAHTSEKPKTITFTQQHARKSIEASIKFLEQSKSILETVDQEIYEGPTLVETRRKAETLLTFLDQTYHYFPKQTMRIEKKFDKMLTRLEIINALKTNKTILLETQNIDDAERFIAGYAQSSQTVQSHRTPSHPSTGSRYTEPTAGDDEA